MAIPTDEREALIRMTPEQIKEYQRKFEEGVRNMPDLSRWPPFPDRARNTAPAISVYDIYAERNRQPTVFGKIR
jgi:hypothetical protein